jgi:exosortase
MATTAANLTSPVAKKHAGFVAFVLISSLAFYKVLAVLIDYTLHDESRSHLMLIPLVAIILLYLDRRRIFANIRPGIGPGVALILGALILYFVANRSPFPQDGNMPLAVSTLALILAWAGGFLLFYGPSSLEAAAFPMLFLLLMVPLPDVILDRVIHALQTGSTEIAYLIFQAVGTPVVRDGFLLTVPTVTIEVAKECSSIRSSLALFITCLLAAQMFLYTGWKKLVFVVLAMLVSVVKNGIRIATLTLLAIHVDPGFLTGKLHRDGGFVFFLIALAILWPAFILLEKSEKPPKPPSPGGQSPEE